MAGLVDLSVIIPAYKAEATLPDAIQSCRAQTLSTIEVIIVDDASPVSLEDVVRSAAGSDPRILFHRLSDNQGPSAARNAGFARATGQFIAVLDADDTMAPERLAGLHALAIQTGADIVADNLTELKTTDGVSETRPFLDLDPHQPVRPVSLLDLMQSGYQGPFSQSLGYLKPVFRRAFLEQERLRYDVSLRNSEDYFFLAEALVRGAQMMFSPRPGYIYRRHEGSISYRIHPDDAQRVEGAERAFRTRYTSALSPAHKAASRRRERAMQNLARFETLVRHLKAGHTRGAIATLLRHPDSLGFHLLRAAASVWKRLS